MTFAGSTGGRLTATPMKLSVIHSLWQDLISKMIQLGSFDRDTDPRIAKRHGFALGKFHPSAAR